MKRTPLTGYQWKLLFFLSVATFFEGYDFFAVFQLLPALSVEFKLDRQGQGYLLSFISLGTVIAYVLVRKADQWGRRVVLMVTILGYTFFSLVTALSVNVWMFAVAQLFAGIFLIAEWAISMVFAAEEFPADRRGTVIGVVQAFGSLGAIVCAVVVPLLLRTEYGWRSVYLVGFVPLVIMAIARRGIRETRRFEQQVRDVAKQSFLRIWRTPYRNRVLQLALIWGLIYVCNKTAVSFWKMFAMFERDFSEDLASHCVGIATAVALPLAFFAGKLLDVIGRRWGAVVTFTIASVSTLGAFTLHSPTALTISLIGGVFATTAVMPVLNAFTSELFPTDLRSDAFAWANNLLGRLTYVAAPIAVGHFAGTYGLGVSVAATAVFPILAIVFVLVFLPETKNLELEATASAPAAH